MGLSVLIAEDDDVTRHLLEGSLSGSGYSVCIAENGPDALAMLLGAEAPMLAILDWMMPGLDGPEVCRRVRSQPGPHASYLIMLTAKTVKDDMIVGLDAGADDYMTKPVDLAELHARIRVGERLLTLQTTLANNIKQLQEALSQVNRLQGLLPICCYCKKIRDDRNYWQQVETYLADHANARFSHSICPDCLQDVLQSLAAAPPPKLP